ncbi:IMSP1-like protein [Mya arenaria]|uniref:IMSP1-like protein n=2 Tax=Mya arenaria TaxID=6604 RepID=A0ABY7FSE9_MYAAR|nr:IMSP1-like protein [Mya arenaria]
MEVGGGGRGRDVGVGGGGRDVGVGGGGPGIVVDQDLYQMPAYNPSPWNDDEHVLEHNNCYNYATNKVTNTFAQPGRASHYKPVGPIKADVVRKECYSDGYKKRQDGGQPSKNQNTGPVALVFWPNADGSMHDFHFFRMDSNKMWSHKPGSTKVKNTDNARQLINDPQTAAISPYDFVCYLGNNAKVNIN